MYAHNFRHFPPWLAGKIVKTTGPLSFEVEMLDGRVISQHQDYICKCLTSAGTVDANLLDGFTDTLDEDSTDVPNGNSLEAPVVVPRKILPVISILHLITLPIIMNDDIFKEGRV